MADQRRLLKGNEAFAEAAITAGCRYYFGYPITPQNEITEYLSSELSDAGGQFIQAESELAAISMGFGAAAAGGKVLISSSSPGIALMQEGISFLCSADLPIVLLNVSRGGPGVGGIQPGQADYFQATRGGGNGDYHVIVYAPSSIQESIDILQKAYKVADHYRNPVMLLVDGMLGQMMEPVEIPKRGLTEGVDEIIQDKPWVISGHREKREKNVIKSLRLKPEELEESITKRTEKYNLAKEELPEYEETNMKAPEVVFVAFGSTSRIVKEAIKMFENEGISAGLIRPVTLWPFPNNVFEDIPESAKAVISVELSEGQLIQDVMLSLNGKLPVHLINRNGGMLITPEEVVARTKEIMEVE